MRSTMMDVPLTVTALMRYGTTAYGDREVVTCTGDGTRRPDLRRDRRRARPGWRTRCAASAWTATSGSRTLMWNNAEHLEAYLAIPSMGAVLHTLNLRLDPQIIGYIATHAGDDVVIVGRDPGAAAGPGAAARPTIRHMLVTGPGPERMTRALAELGRPGPRGALLRGPAGRRSPTRSTGRSWTSGPPRPCATPAAPPATRRAWSTATVPRYLHSMARLPRATRSALSERDQVLPVVPMFHANAWGLPYAAVHGRRRPDHAGPVPAARAAGPADRGRAARRWPARCPRSGTALLQHVRANGGDLSSLRLVPCGGSAVPHALQEAYEKELGVHDRAGLGDDRDLAAGQRGPPARRAARRGGLALPGHPGPADVRRRGPAGRRRAARCCRTTARRSARSRCAGRGSPASYYKDDDPEKFRDGWLRTGDVGTIDPLGYVTLTDRAKDVIKSGGEWISSMELENALMAHPEVAEAAVIGVPDEKWGERPLATVVVRPGAAVDGRRAARVPGRAGCRAGSCPSAGAFIAEVPKTSVGKFAKTRIRECLRPRRLRGDRGALTGPGQAAGGR